MFPHFWILQEVGMATYETTNSSWPNVWGPKSARSRPITLRALRLLAK
jgi:hypothetical protein